MVDPVARPLATAPPDDEPVTERDRRRFHHGQERFAQNAGIPMEDVLAEIRGEAGRSPLLAGRLARSHSALHPRSMLM